ncbi:hypothetical protein C8Q70DRAFT_905404 [Cubamyces menziesii]|nr:hypothetical protein C8Q70DRAFT_905404 [Cubamyces menziesii]
MPGCDTDSSSYCGPHFCPMPYRYGVMRIDAVASVQHLRDSIATKQAEALDTKEYLVYLDEELDPPFPDSPWFPFIVSPIANELRYHDTTYDFTPDMCAPIHPNTDHPAHRVPLRTTPEFPFPHCYHWLGANIHVRIRARPGSQGFGDARAIRLPAAERLTMQIHWAYDMNARWRRFLTSRDGNNHGAHSQSASSSIPRTNGILRTSGLTAVGSAHSNLRELTPSSSEQTRMGRDSVFSYTESDESTSVYSQDSSTGGLNASRNDPDSDAEFIPIVDFTFDLRSMLNAERIPSPCELIEERDNLVK